MTKIKTKKKKLIKKLDPQAFQFIKNQFKFKYFHHQLLQVLIFLCIYKVWIDQKRIIDSYLVVKKDT